MGQNFDIFFQLNEMRDEAKTWWLFSGPDVASSYFFKKKIRVALESRTLISVPLLQAMTLKKQKHDCKVEEHIQICTQIYNI